jgi:ABC-type glycerol-3-phosphate transport system permease component
MATTEDAVSAAPAQVESTSHRSIRRTRHLALYAVLVPLALIFAFPFFWTVASSLKAPSEILTYPPQLLPAVPQWQNYARVFALSPFAQWIFNTVWVVAVGTLGAVLTSSLVAYSFARFRYRGRDFIFMLTLATLMLPAQVTLIPQYIIWSKMGFANTLYPLWLPQWFGGGASGAFYIFMMRQFIMTIPRELDDAALIDGANRFRIFWMILLPLCIPALATVTIISFIANWDDYLTPLIYLNSQEMYTLALGLSFFRNYPESGGLPQQHLLMAATVMTTLPPIILFFAAQRYFVKGIVLSGLKG